MKAVLFDLDGTLLDTRDMILDSFRYAYTTVLGADTLPPEDKLLAMVGIPLKEQMEIIAPNKSEELCAAYRENNARVHATMHQGFEGTEETLAALKQQGFRMAVITSKMHGSAVHGLELEGIDGYFEFVLGADDSELHKPNPEPLLMAAERMGLEPASCAYIGDSPFDMLAATSAGMYAVGAVWGMFTQQELLDAGADILAKTIDKVPEIFTSMR